MRLMKLTTLFLLAAAICSAENWPQWRGPLFNGSSPEKNLPSEWSKTDNVAWSTTLPGPGAATPIIWGDHVFISSIDSQSESLLALGLDRKTGKILWRETIAKGIRLDSRSNFASPSPVTDGKVVIFFYSNGELAGFDFTGRKLWARNIQTDYGTFAFQWTFSSTPLLFEGKLYQPVLQRDVPVRGRGRADGPNESYLLAMEPATGKTLWRHVRPSAAVAESREAYATPVPFTHQGRTDLLIAGGDCVTGHDPATGKELWRWETWNNARIGHWRLVPSPVAGDGIILACAPKAAPIYAVKAGGSGALGDAGLAWKSDQQPAISSDVPTPLFYLGDFFVLNDLRKNLSRVEPRTGRVKWTIETPGRAKFEASPTGADGKIYLMNFKGEVVVVDPEKGTVLRTIPMGEDGDDMTRSSIAVAQGQLFIRTNGKLYCAGRK